ncbi:hypothetical protein COT82_00095 [Candidatus Campbellbacteria bacterium CG10_big_fil_rev_8_21_14_0_10_35_52]|uniref:SHS2 domain-containing protein n=1 Tax=Candidatus Campbellbacteria bacterium CG10_big_fil_rev_8_21_14_0_10_35_52 TaxID=1974527 RepID=A0A2M6WW36_9BACT|nr:MAG: hypothetical protein COT82_00095 [Candidatus Campbellbacteria bacterium CG10_big_fil_rev_8_21_14_0_10_35_52]
MSLFDFLKKKETSVVGIDIGASSIKVVQLKKRQGVAVLETYGELSLGPYSDAEIGQATNLPASKIAEALKDLLIEANVTAKKAGVSIPFSSSLISLILMPALNPKNLSSMIPIEARKYIPVPISEVTLDWFVVPDEGSSFDEDYEYGGQINEDSVKKTEGGKKIKVLLVAIHNDILNKYNEIINSTDLAVGFFEIEIFSAIRAVVEQSIIPTMVIDMGARDTKLYIVEFGIIKASHVINSGAQDITQTLSKSLSISISKAEESKRKSGIIENFGDNKIVDSKDIIVSALERIFTEANRVMTQYQQKNNKNIGNVILTGSGAMMKGILPVAEKHFETSVTISDPFSKTKSPAFLEEILKEVGPGFAVAVGLALRRLQEID